MKRYCRIDGRTITPGSSLALIWPLFKLNEVGFVLILICCFMATCNVFQQLILSVVPIIASLTSNAQEWLFLQMSSLVVIFVARCCVRLATKFTFVVEHASVRFHVNAQTVFVFVQFVAKNWFEVTV